MNSVQYRNSVYQGAASECRPVKCMCVDKIELGAAPAQLEEQFEEEICLREETRIRRDPIYRVRGVLAQWFGEVGGSHAVRNGYLLYIHAGHGRAGSRKERHLVPTLHQPLRKVS